MNYFRIIIIVGILLLLSQGIFGKTSCTFENKHNYTGTNPQFSTMAYNSANTTLTVGSTNITSRTWNSINPFDSFTMISGPMSSMMDMVVYENKPLLVGNSTRVYELAGTWASKIALTNTSYINQIEKLDNNYIITTIGSDNKAHVFTIDSSNNKTELSTIPNNATSIVSLGIDNIGKIWINTNQTIFITTKIMHGSR